MSILSLLVSALAAFAIGMVWYSPVLFLKPWQRLSGITNPSKKDMIIASIALFIAFLVTSYVLSIVLISMGAFSIATGMETAFWMWLGFSAAYGTTSIFYDKKPVGLYIINQGYFLVALLAMGAILATW